MSEFIYVEGIETNNLKQIDISIEKRALNLIIGPSGSGKSSLAYDTIAQIGQHEYMAMFADDIAEPSYKIKSYQNMIAAVPLKQSNGNNNLHSTIGTYFGLNRSVALLYAVVTGISEDHFTLNRSSNLCENCHGLGYTKALDINRIIDYNIPLNDNPFRCWNTYKDFYKQILSKYCEEIGIDSSKTFRQLTGAEKKQLLYGESSLKYSFQYKKTNMTSRRTTKYYGILTGTHMMLGYKPSDRFYSEKECEICHGKKYNTELDQYTIYGLSIGEFMTTPFIDLITIIDKICQKYTNPKIQFTLSTIHNFIQKAIELNLGHLFLHRSIPTLSGGELQRLRMVQVFNAQLSDLLIVLDEPLAGLSGEERQIIYDNIIRLANKHTILVVDHSDVFVQKAKKIYALGPGGGLNGGKLIDVKSYLQKESIKQIPSVHKTSSLIHINILNDVYQYHGADISIAENALNLVTGPSGIGKTTLLREYFPQQFESYLYINQKPIMSNKTSSVSTALEIFGNIQNLFAKKTGKDRRWFSNQSGCLGACPVCGGAGYIEYGYDNRTKITMSCEDCDGTGFNKIIKKYKIGNKTMLDIWNMTIDEGSQYFSKLDPKITTILRNASSILLGHLKLGQATATLSDGENIRIKVMKAAKSSLKVLGIDEPFKGLSPSEVYLIASFLEQIRSKGKTIVVIDHSDIAEPYFAKKTMLTVRNGIITEA